MTPELLNYYFKKYNLTMSDPHPYKLPVLRKYDSLEKDWYVEYYAYSERDAKLKRKRVVLAEPTEKQRIERAKSEIKLISEMLKAGAIIDPIKKKLQKSEITKTSKLTEAIKYFLEQNKATLEQNTYESYKRHLDHLINYLNRHQNQSLTLEQLDIQIAYQFTDELISEVKHGNRTRNNVKDTCSIFFNYFKKRRIIEENPFNEIQSLRTHARKYTAISKEHVKKLLQSFQESEDLQLDLFVQFEYYAALRPNKELRLLKIEDILDKTIAVPCDTSKNKEKEHVRIAPPLEKKIQEHNLRSYPGDYYIFSKNGLPGPEHNGKKYQYMRHREHLKALKIDHLQYDVYSWKHSGVIALFLATQNLELVRQHCRHKDVATTIKYLRDLGQFTDYDEINKFPEI
ncbi:tyrosine-type recombinase/integrase [Lacihabitans soyangensis]|uniref:Site-specific integrase n=1 Tax=Lacihabitans soyangensis TaxID=869394 RepID=A0AAE3KW62_9BACT|nr:phage integrase SAM-like domain-containing protein [Lacihabitans soyangensis]MCP9765111.1 site-specific integrase [Lacihabitans soyangensis]